MKHYDYEISLFIDGELPDEEQNKLFEHLAECYECRSALVEFQSTKIKSKSYYGAQLPEANGTIIPMAPEVKTAKTNIFKTAFYIAAAACMLIGLLFLMNQMQQDKLKYKLANLETKYSLLENNFKQASIQKQDEVNVKEASTEKVKNFHAKKLPGKSEIQNIKPNSVKMKTENRKSDYAQYFSSLKTERITKNDFLIPQLIGN